ncbi:MAG: hypothetical protein AAGU77_00590 [Bacillota bacterium]
MRRIALPLSITLVFFAAGCAKAGNQDAAKANQELDVSSGPAAADSGSTMVYGRVDSIVGNEVVLALGEPQKGGGAAAASSDQDAGQAGSEQQSDATGKRQQGNWGGNTSDGATSGEMPSGKLSSGEIPSGEMPSGEAPSDKMLSGESPSFNSSAAQSGNAGVTRQSGRSVSLTYTGETATYLLPVGMAIGSGDFSDVTEGMVLSLTLNAEETITAVSILSR